MKRSNVIAFAMCIGLATNCGVQEDISTKSDAEVAYYEDRNWGPQLQDNQLETIKALGLIAVVATAAIVVGPRVTKIDTDGLKFWGKINYEKGMTEAGIWKKFGLVNQSQVESLKLRQIIAAPSKFFGGPGFTPRFFRDTIKDFRNAKGAQSFEELLKNQPAVADFVINQAASLSYLASKVSLESFEDAYKASKLDMGGADQAYNFFKSQNAKYHLNWIDTVNPENTMRNFQSQVSSEVKSQSLYIRAVEDLLRGPSRDASLLENVKSRFTSPSVNAISNSRLTLEKKLTKALKDELGLIHNSKELKKALKDLGLTKLTNNYWKRIAKELNQKQPRKKQITKILGDLEKDFMNSPIVQKNSQASGKKYKSYLLVRNYFGFTSVVY